MTVQHLFNPRGESDSFSEGKGILETEEQRMQ